MPVIVTLAYLYWAYGVIEWANGLLALVGIVIFIYDLTTFKTAFAILLMYSHYLRFL